MQFEINGYEGLREATAALCAYLLEEGVSQDRTFDCRLVINELVGNVLKHSGVAATLESVVKDGFVEISVRSSVQFTPPQISKCSSVYAENGRGLYLVDFVSEQRTVGYEGGITVRIKISE